MKVVVVGNGGREQAIAAGLVQSERVTQCYCLPGNGGTAQLPKTENITIGVDALEEIGSFCQQKKVDLVVVGPELPLTLGLADHLQALSIPVFGPSQAGAQLEASKSWAKALMQRAGVPTAWGETFTEPGPALEYVNQQGAPIVIKADGLAAGKGVVVALTLGEAQGAVVDLFAAGFSKLVIEEYLLGEEVSVLALSDGRTILPLLPAQDHKRIGEGDTGPNTGGMGVYAPAPLVSPALMAEIRQTILQPTLQELQNQGIDYRGILYAGLMISPAGEVKVLEYNCRFGDPETQAILPLLETPLVEVLLACCQQRLDRLPPLQWRSGSAVCVVMASAGYPGPYQTGEIITGIAEAETRGALVFQAGTQLHQGQLVTAGGRVLGVTALGPTLAEAITNVYGAIQAIDFPGAYYRRDIGHRACPLHNWGEGLAH
jgi:phosphoribosylamine--glycine ligase